MAYPRFSGFELGLSGILIGTFLSVSFEFSSPLRRFVTYRKDSAIRYFESYIQRLSSPSA